LSAATGEAMVGGVKEGVEWPLLGLDEVVAAMAVGIAGAVMVAVVEVVEVHLPHYSHQTRQTCRPL